MKDTARKTGFELHPETDESSLRRPILMILFGLALLVLAAVPIAADDEHVDEEHAAASEKILGCNTNNHYCNGTFQDLISRIKTYPDGRVLIYFEPTVLTTVSTSAECTFYGNRVEVNPKTDTDGGEENILDQIYLTAALGTAMRVDFYKEAATGYCKLENIYVYL